MNSPPSHYYHGYIYDPSHINTQSSPFTIAPFYQQPHRFTTPHCHDGISNPPSTFTSSLNPPPNLQSILQQLKYSQQICLQTMSNCMDAFSALNADLTSYNYFPTVLNNQHQHQSFYHDPYFESQSSFIINHNSFNPQQTNKISTNPIVEDAEKQKGVVVETFKDLNPLKLVPILPIQSNPDSVSEVVGEHVITEDFNDVAPSKLKLDLPTTLSTETDARSRDDVVTVKGREEGIRQVLPSISQSPCDSNRTASLTIKACGDVSMGLALVKINVPMSLVSAKPRSINTNLPSPGNEVVHDVAVADAPLQPPLSIFMLTDDSIQIFDPGGNIVVSYSVSRRCLQIRNFQSFAMIFSPAVEVFDADHRSLSPATKSHDNTILLSLLCLPYDRGKMVFSSFLFPMANLAPTMVLFPAQGAASGWPWVPWSSMKMTASVTTTSVKHVREEDTHQG